MGFVKVLGGKSSQQVMAEAPSRLSLLQERIWMEQFQLSHVSFVADFRALGGQ
jgi:hypothetical protein